MEYRLKNTQRNIDITIPYVTISNRLVAEKRETKPCPFCKSKFVEPCVDGAFFYMKCFGCSAQGPHIADYNDPAGLCETSWVVALKRCHDCWNGRG